MRNKVPAYNINNINQYNKGQRKHWDGAVNPEMKL